MKKLSDLKIASVIQRVTVKATLLIMTVSAKLRHEGPWGRGAWVGGANPPLSSVFILQLTLPMYDLNIRRLVESKLLIQSMEIVTTYRPISKQWKAYLPSPNIDRWYVGYHAKRRMEMDKSNDTCVVNNNMDGISLFAISSWNSQVQGCPGAVGLWGNYYRLEWLPPDRLKLKRPCVAPGADARV